MSTESIAYNVQRAYYAAWVATPISFIQILIFLMKDSSSNEVQRRWVHSIVLSHIVLILGINAFALLLHNLSKKKKKNILKQVAIVIEVLFILFMGGIIAMQDQLVTPSITPFLVGSMAVPLVFIIPPFISFFLYVGAYGFFYFIMALTQYNQNILISNRVNGFTAVGIGFCLGVVLWYNEKERQKQRKRIEKQQLSLEEKNRQLVEMNQVKDQLFTIVTHDMREPLATMITLMQLLEEEAALMDEYGEVIQAIKGQVGRSSVLLEEMIEWCKTQKEGIICYPEQIDISAIIQENLSFFKNKLDGKNIKVKNYVKPLSFVYADQETLTIVIRNLLSNAIKFTNPGESILLKTIEGEKIILCIEDYGKGMNEKQLEAVLKGEKVRPSLGTSGEKGLGVGLWFSRQLVFANKGDLWAESSVEKGTTFYLKLPKMMF